MKTKTYDVVNKIYVSENPDSFGFHVMLYDGMYPSSKDIDCGQGKTFDEAMLDLYSKRLPQVSELDTILSKEL